MREAFVGKVKSAALRAINYRPEVEAFRARRGASTRDLGAMASELGQSYGQVFTRVDCEPSFGVELISQSDMFAVETQGRRIRMDSMPRPEKHRVRRWQILIAGAGQMEEGNLFARSIIADGRLVDRFLGGHAVALTFHEPGSDENLWAYAFLNTRVGLAAVQSCAYGTSVPGIRLDLLAQLPIPIADRATMSRVGALVREVVEQRERFAATLSAAQRTISDLPEMREAWETCADRRARCVAWTGDLPTLRAWNFASAGDALALLRRRWPGTVADVMLPGVGIEKGGRFARIEVQSPHGVDLLSQRDVFMMRPIGRRIAAPAIVEQLLVDNADLFVASRGQLVDGALFGSVELAANLPRGAIVSEDFVRLRTRDTASSHLLVAYLSTPLGRRLMRTTAYGTSIPGMRLDLLARLPWPTMAAAAAAHVTSLVDASVGARTAARRAETEAIRIIEEEVLPQWLA